MLLSLIQEVLLCLHFAAAVDTQAGGCRLPLLAPAVLCSALSSCSSPAHNAHVKPHFQSPGLDVGKAAIVAAEYIKPKVLDDSDASTGQDTYCHRMCCLLV